MKEEKSQYVADNIFTDYRNWKQEHHIGVELTQEEHEANRSLWEKDYNMRKGIKTPEEFEKYCEYQRKLQKEDEEWEKNRVKLIRRDKIGKGITITFISLAVAALIGGIVYVKDLNDKYNAEYNAKHFDKNGTPVQVAITDIDEYVTPFDKACKYEVNNDIVTKKINANCVYFYINNETGEVVPLVLIDADTKAPRSLFGKHYYNLDEELVICYKNFPDLFDSRYINQEYYDYLEENFEKKTMKEALANVSISATSDYYTKDEIKVLKDELERANIIINGTKRQSM